MQTRDDVLTVHSELKKALEKLHLERSTATKNKKASSLPLLSESHNRQPGVTSESKRLCDYSSSEPSTTPMTNHHRSSNNIHEMSMFKSAQESAAMSPPITYHSNTPPPHRSSQQDLSSQIDHADTDETMSASSSIHGSESHRDRAESPCNPGSFCSQNTWRMESPFVDQMNANDSWKRQRANSNSSNSDGDERMDDCSPIPFKSQIYDSKCSSPSFHRNVLSEELELDQGENLSMLSPTLSERVDENSLPNGGHTITDLFKENFCNGFAARNNFPFLTEEPRTDQSFRDCFRDIANTPQKKSSTMEMFLPNLVPARSGRKRQGTLQEWSPSPKISHGSHQIITNDTRHGRKENSPASPIRTNPNKNASNALEALMVSYCNSDSDSD